MNNQAVIKFQQDRTTRTVTGPGIRSEPKATEAQNLVSISFKMGAANTKEAQPTASPRSTNDRLIIPDAERRENDRKWEKAEDFAAVIRLNRSLLRGETRSTVYHCGPIDAETLPLVESLLRLHDFGMLTHDGQPQLQENPELVTLNGKSSWYGRKQRPFLCFLVPRLEGPISSASLQTFCDMLLQHPSTFTHIVDDPRSAPAKIQSNTAEERYPFTLERTTNTVVIGQCV